MTARSFVVAVLLGIASCGGSGAVPATQGAPGTLEVAFEPGPIAHAVEAIIRGVDLERLEGVRFRVRSKPGHASADVHVTYTRTYLEREGAIDGDAATVTVPVFGLYGDYDNQVEIEVDQAGGVRLTRSATVATGKETWFGLPVYEPIAIDPELGTSFLLFQIFGRAYVTDVDGEVRWLAPFVGGPTFPHVVGPSGLVVGSMQSNEVWQIDWLGRFTSSVISDPRCRESHHVFARGPLGILNAVSFTDEELQQPESVLVEMSPTGTVLALWDFDRIFRDLIQSHGEDATALVSPGADWFHMNSVVYDPLDDSLIVSSRENCIVKVDHATGQVRWLLGNPEKLWYQAFPLSLQPLALEVVGEPPVGQHSLSLSPDGTVLMMFDNGRGNLVLDDVGDSRAYSRVVAFRIDEVLRTAEQIWSYDFDQQIYAPFQSSAYATASGEVLIVCSNIAGGGGDRIFVVDHEGQVRYEARMRSSFGGGVAYAARELRLDDLLLD